MPRKSYTRKRGSRMGRKRGSAKRAYTKRRKTYKRKMASSKRLLSRKPGTQKGGAYVTRIPRTLDVGNRVSQKSVYDVTFLNTFTCYPAVSAGTDGAFVQSFWANASQFVMRPVSPSIINDWNLGSKMAVSGGDTGSVNGVVWQMATPQLFWLNSEVISADIEIIATPMEPESADVTNYAQRAFCWLTLSKGWNPHQSDSTVGGVFDNASINRSRFTIVGTSEHNTGSESKSVVLRGSFTPKRIFNVADIADREGAFRAEYGQIADPPDYGLVALPNKGAFWNFGFVSAAPVISALDPVAFKRGIPLPHTVQVKINYRCRMLNPVAGVSVNQPL